MFKSLQLILITSSLIKANKTETNKPQEFTILCFLAFFANLHLMMTKSKKVKRELHYPYEKGFFS